MLKITGDHIAALNDEDLRTLVGRLCESELHSLGLSTSAVTWGGNQNAADGGIDVRVRIDNGNPPGGFIPRASVGFQVKKTDFTPGLIGPEMRPEGELRNSIQGLIAEGGAYIIASSEAWTSDSALASRVNAMRAAVADVPGNEALLVDFYDRSRLATWTRTHPGLVVWVRERIGRGISGWQPYSSWAVSPEGVNDEYLLDDKARLHEGTNDEKGVEVTVGINRIRDILRKPRSVVRLAGLSGVGKTRLVQALFDTRVGERPLDSALVIYTDMKDNPSPQPTGMATDLIALRTRAIVVIDNCAPDLHRRITEVCRTSESPVSAITVEYDIQDDEPEGTDVFRLEPSSIGLVSKLIERRFPTMARPSVDRIADFSGGNARIAMALANTLERHESVAGLRDGELFKRLFHQRQQHDESLLKAAQVCSLLYSFQGESLVGDDAELPKLAALVGTNARELFAKVAELKKRDLVQRRSVWRAVLPQAIANRLAAMALTEIPPELIEASFNTERMLRSFSRRLGYLHESDEANRIAERWLGSDEWLADVARLNELGLVMFINISPVSPEATLAAIERSLSGVAVSELKHEWKRSRICSILQSIAYDAALFDRCVAAMIPLTLAGLAEQSGPSESLLEGLFHIVLSGTHATIEQRVAMTHDLLDSNEPQKQNLGIRLLQALLKNYGFSANEPFEFGSRVRDYGWRAKSHEATSHWYATTLQLARRFVSGDGETASAVRSIVAQSIWGLWTLGPKVQEQFEAIASEIALNGYWEEGWISVRSLLLRRINEPATVATERLRSLEVRLRPKTLFERVRAVVLAPTFGPIDYAGMDDINNEAKPATPSAWRATAHALAEELGKEICSDSSLFLALLPKIVRGNAHRLYSFGRGIALASEDRRCKWSQLTQALAETEESKRNGDALQGFLNGLATVDPQLSEAILEEAMSHETLGSCFPYLQSAVIISEAGVERLKRAVALRRAHPGAFRFLGSRSDVQAGDLAAIVGLLVQQDDGFGAVIDILAMSFFTDDDQEKTHPTALIEVGRELLSSPDFSRRDNSFDHNLHIIANVCLQGLEGATVAKLLCERLRQGFKDHTIPVYEHGYLLQSLFRQQPNIALDSFFTCDDDSVCDIGDFDDPSDRGKCPFDEIPLDEITTWCNEQPTDRYPSLARVVRYQIPSNDGNAEWTLLAKEILKRAPDPVSILKIYIGRFYLVGGWGSQAAVVESRLGLLDQLEELQNGSVDDYISGIRPKLVSEIALMRKEEDERDSARDQRFE